MTCAPRSLLAFSLVILALGGCGGRRTGDEEFFSGGTLPPAESSQPVASTSSTAAPSASASASQIPVDPCDAPPPQGFPKCGPGDKGPCLQGAIGGCELRCPGRAPAPAPCAK
ncbi:MAG: hypothetical protein U0271_13120 [Polyangiaceae bacterium]